MIQSKNQYIVILTNTTNLPHNQSSQRTGFDIKEVAYIYEYIQEKAKIPLIYASPRGGECHPDPMSIKYSHEDEIVKKFLDNEKAQESFKNTTKIEDLDFDEARVLIFPGGPGVLFDLPNERNINTLVSKAWRENDGFVASIGHGIAALLNVRDSKTSQPLLKDKQVTCNTIEEEREMNLDKSLPFMLEETLKKLGARFEKESKFESNVVVDERIITAQNRNSAREWVETIIRNTQRR